MSELSPAAIAVDDALAACIQLQGEIIRARPLAAAALRAAADQVVPKEWPTIEDYNEYDQGVAAAHIKHRNQILAIADELEVRND
jgi:hypothetical protein